LGLAAKGIGHGWVSPQILGGVLFLCLLPSTVQSSIAFTSVARGNVAAAVCSASASNLIGIVLTPALVSLLMGAQGGGPSIDAVQSIVLNGVSVTPLTPLLFNRETSFVDHITSILRVRP
jgi:sodium/bile acid cotransporter 7